MKQIALWGAFLVLFLIPFTGNAQSFSHEAEVGGFVLPTSFSFIDADRIVVGEKGGNIYLANIQTGAKSLIYTIPNVNTFNDRGLVGLTTHNNFLNNGYIYLSYTHENSPADHDGPKTARIVRVVYDFNTGLVDPNSYTILVGTVAGTPAMPSCNDYAPLSDCIASNSGAHSAGGLRFGPDGYLYASLGDGADFYAVDSYALKSLDPDYLTGKILRLNDDGTAPASNPFYEAGNPTSNRSKVYAMGIRNSFRFDFLENGDLVAGEVGWSTHEELNLVTAGANFGWPCYEGNNLQAAYSVVFPTECGAVGGVTQPLLEYGHQTAGSYSLTGGDQATNAAYGAYAGKYFFGDYSQNTMLAADYSNGSISNVEVVYQNPGGPVDIQVGPDNYLYYIAIYTGEIRKLVLDTGTAQPNRDPIADFYVDGGLGDAPVDVVFHGEISSDPDKDILTYDWNFGDGQTGSGATPTHTYTANGSYIVSLTVDDGRGGTAVHVGRVFVGDVAYNANPIHIVTTYAPQPLYVGLQSDISTNVSNIGGGDDDFIVYWEIYNSAGDRVLKRSDVVLATDGEDVTKTFTWLPPGIDTYRIDIGIFSDDWRYGYAWIAGAAVFTVEQRDAETSTSTPTDPTPPPPDPTPTPSTCPLESDHDGDGWGWDGQKGCRVDSGTTPTDPTPPPTDPTPTPSTCPPESDHDGDGWGWDGQKGCRVDSGTTPTDPTDPTPPPTDPNPPEDDPVGECYDWDGDGWGWDGVKGCKVDSSTPTDPTPPPPDPTPTPSTCPPESDHDGDGWGWDGQKGCRV